MYHATLTYFFQKLDQTGMYFLLISFISYLLFKIFPKIKYQGKEYISNRFFIASAVIVQLFFFFFLWKLPVNILFPTLTLVFILTNLFLLVKIGKIMSLIQVIVAFINHFFNCHYSLAAGYY